MAEMKEVDLSCSIAIGGEESVCIMCWCSCMSSLSLVVVHIILNFGLFGIRVCTSNNTTSLHHRKGPTTPPTLSGKLSLPSSSLLFRSIHNKPPISKIIFIHLKRNDPSQKHGNHQHCPPCRSLDPLFQLLSLLR